MKSDVRLVGRVPTIPALVGIVQTLAEGEVRISKDYESHSQTKEEQA